MTSGDANGIHRKWKLYVFQYFIVCKALIFKSESSNRENFFKYFDRLKNKNFNFFHRFYLRVFFFSCGFKFGNMREWMIGVFKLRGRFSISNSSFFRKKKFILRIIFA